MRVRVRVRFTIRVRANLHSNTYPNRNTQPITTKHPNPSHHNVTPNEHQEFLTKKVKVDNVEMTAQIWDTAGQVSRQKTKTNTKTKTKTKDKR